MAYKAQGLTLQKVGVQLSAKVHTVNTVHGEHLRTKILSLRIFVQISRME